MTALVVSDLDRTLIYSPAALQLSEPDEDCPPLVSVETLDGRPHSFLTLAAATTLTEIARRSVFVPVTTRTVRQYRRVRFPGVHPRFAVVSNGGHLLVDGEPDPSWQANVQAAVGGGVPLTAVVSALAERANGAWVRNRRVADGLFCYLVVEPTEMPDEFLPRWRSWCADRGWVVSVQGRKVYALPRTLTKERALAEVARRVRADWMVAAGDGVLDAGFLTAADVGIRPAHGELADQSWTAPQVTVTAQVGVHAGQEIVEFFAKQIAAQDGPRAQAAAIGSALSR